MSVIETTLRSGGSALSRSQPVDVVGRGIVILMRPRRELITGAYQIEVASSALRLRACRVPRLTARGLSAETWRAPTSVA